MIYIFQEIPTPGSRPSDEPHTVIIVIVHCIVLPRGGRYRGEYKRSPQIMISNSCASVGAYTYRGRGR